jgi:hypothetical protein
MGTKGGFNLLYKIQRSVPAQTTKTAPDKQTLKISKGTIIQWVIYMPEECADLMQFRVYYGGHILLPYNEDFWMHGFFVPTTIPDDVNIDGAPYELDVVAYNDDDSYSHEYNLYVNVEPVEEIVTEEAEEGRFQRFLEWIGAR